MRLVHTADVHLDACFAGAGLPVRVANRRRQSLRDVFQAIVRRAAEWPADALLIPGDLFEHERVTPDTAAFLKGLFDSVRPLPVVIAPGNHDPYMAGSPYVAQSWPENVVIFNRPEWIAVPLCDGRLVVHGFAFDGYEISSNPFGALAIPCDGAVHVALGHGTERAHQPPDGKSYAPFDAETAFAPGLAYFALGHFHRLTEIPVAAGRWRMMYSGAPEGHGFDESGEHVFLEIEIEGEDLRVVPKTSGRVCYAVHDLDVTPLASTQDLVAALRKMATAYSAPPILRVTLKGLCDASLVGDLQAVRDALANDFEYLLLEDETLPAEDFDELSRDPTSLGAFVQRLNDEIRDAPDPDRRRMLMRARAVGVAAHRGHALDIAGLRGGEDRP
ncbi:MAG TPA: DNA repair exonuclease [Candidatus Hydrogenedentes bacterium]|nr:DNA repair exonuclease [Candidatus Hydrogenedentota bacterium]HRT21415.1 DNA repair exonuclease [Candidatus Hydrogenedentota bacterium]HRT66303.1 DNA repair exonuclease [Candidatus Hydrogenedentota bacterium]